MGIRGIDVAQTPEICEPLELAIAPLSPAQKEAVRGLVIVREARGPCADRCPDLATALLSDGALAFYRNVARELDILDAAFDGPTWHGGDATPEAVSGLLAALDLPDWQALVGRVRALPLVPDSVPRDIPSGDARLFQAIVTHGAPTLLGGVLPLADFVRHELGHAILDHLEPSPGRIKRWATLSHWMDHTGTPADGYASGVWTSEKAIVAVRMVLGLPRGPAWYVPGLPVTLATGYAAFDPMEDYAESLRLADADPVALGERAPAKLLVMAADTRIQLKSDNLSAYVVPGVSQRCWTRMSTLASRPRP